MQTVEAGTSLILSSDPKKSQIAEGCNSVAGRYELLITESLSCVKIQKEK